MAAEDIRGEAHSVKSKQHVARTLGKRMTNAMRCSGLPGNSNCLTGAGFITEILSKSQTGVQNTVLFHPVWDMDELVKA